MKLHDARVVLTGASGGIGLAIATALCASGARVSNNWLLLTTLAL